MISHRNSQGNITFLMVLTVGILVLIVLCAVAFDLMLGRRSQAEYAADSLALTLATNINSGDRIGQINEIQESSRELVLVSRQNLQNCTDGNKRLAGLCDRLLEEARSGHELVESERKNQIGIIQDEVSSSIKDYNHRINQHKKFSFLGFETEDPEVLRVDLGQIAGVNSNVRALDAIPELYENDTRKLYVDKKSKLYRSDVNAMLPSPDLDLDFHFASLPAYVGTTAAPARNTNVSMFVPYGTVYSGGKTQAPVMKKIPSAIQLYCRMNMTMPWEHHSTDALELRATGSASGASFESR